MLLQGDRFAQLYAKDQQFRSARPLERVTDAIRQPGRPLLEILTTVMDSYADRPALAERARELRTDPATGRSMLTLLPRFDTVSYGELWERAGAIAAEWHHDPLEPVRAGEFVAILGFGGADYVAIEFACLRLGAVCVPLQATATSDSLTPIIAETEARLLAVNVENLETAVKIATDNASIRRLVVFDYHPEVDGEREQVEAARTRLADTGNDLAFVSVTDVLDRGRSSPPAPEPTADADADDRLAVLIYTSGSTGTPKGAVYTEGVVRTLWQGFWPRADFPSLSMIYMPLSHLAGQAILASTLSLGGTAHFIAKTDMSTLAEDLSLVRPTELIVVPRVSEMLFQRYQSEVNARAATGGDRSRIQSEVTTKLREGFLGGRLVWAGSTSAPLSAEMKTFVDSVLGFPLHDGYGSTEGGMILEDRKVTPRVLDYKLADVPELAYFHTDSPYPRGELLLKSAAMIPGYFKRPDATADVFDEDGFYHTGDIMAQVGPDEFVYVDRRNNVLKLSQGEFVAVARLEAIFNASHVVEQIYIYGNSERAYLLAVVVPNKEELAGVDGDPNRLKPIVSESLQRIAEEQRLNSYEIPRDFLIESEPFTPENGLLAGARKLLRPKLKERYGPRLEQLYADHVEREDAELRELRATGHERPVLDTVVRAAQAVLGAAAGELTTSTHFLDLGGDSMSALSFSGLLSDVFGVEVPVGVIMSPANNLRALAGYVEEALGSDPKRTTFATIHGAGSTEVRAADLALERFIDTATLAAAHTLPRSAEPVRTVLLTGANGYLGRFLCLEWLERLAPVGGKVVCLVRAATPEAAQDRLDAAFDSGDPDLLRHYRDLAADHLEVLAGDISEAGLGLDESTWHNLADTVDLIVHAGALVNHVLPYEQMFGPNVVGTAELIRLGLTRRLKQFTFLSTVAVLASQTSSADEDTDIRVTSPVRKLDGSYANGYATSKWAGEILLREAQDACGLPVVTFRSGMIFAHRRYSGQLNTPDVFTRLLLSLLLTGIAPSSFHPNEEPAHYGGLPVDFTAGAITTLGARATDGYETYNVLNPHQDGISLDTYVDWLVEAGYPIKRIGDYETWFSRFETVICALPAHQRQRSILPLLHVFNHPAEPGAVADLPAERFRAAVQEAGIDAEKDIPHVTEALIRKYADDLAQLKLI
ncbi:carboxylic acid reductase [Pseudonocardia xinjiangensis]|uniref:carboxylic acid reductase n=1 Tax=Pseudonocardia xinjiangensis TaxID=75289 RepID=UPI003D8ABB5E